MKTLRALHLASFDGNIGDNANHNGFYRHLHEIPGFRFEIEPLEIRKFYWKQRFFDESFVELVNRYDLLIIGGGNYFELWVEHSPTGTSIMIEPELFKKIKPPVFFNALGVDPGQGASPEACKRFRDFLSIVLDDPKNFVSVRNDGSMDALGEHIGSEFASHVTWTPDAGVCIEVDEDFSVIDPNRRYMAINLAGDMLETRFPGSIGYIDSETFIRSFAGVCEQMLWEGQADEILFVPHIYKDLATINAVLSHIPDSVIRRRISIAPLLHGKGSERKIFALYQKAILSICMRFHANLCSIGLGRPTIALCNYRQIEKLYEEMGLEEYLVQANKTGFETALVDKFRTFSKECDQKRTFFEQKGLQVKNSYRDSIRQVTKWLNKIHNQSNH